MRVAQLTYMAQVLENVGIVPPLQEAIAELGPRADMPHGGSPGGGEGPADGPLGSLDPPRGRPSERPAREGEAAVPLPAGAMVRARVACSGATLHNLCVGPQPHEEYWAAHAGSRGCSPTGKC